MKRFTKKQIEELRFAVMGRISGKRFRHTLGVEHMAECIGEILRIENVNDIRAAALLHDVSKEYSDEKLSDNLFFNRWSVRTKVANADNLSLVVWATVCSEKGFRFLFPNHLSIGNGFLSGSLRNRSARRSFMFRIVVRHNL